MNSKLLVCIIVVFLAALPCFAQGKAPAVIPTPAGFVKITHPELAAMLHTISEGGQPTTTQRLEAFMKKQEYAASLTATKPLPPISIGAVTVLRAQNIKESKFKELAGYMAEAMADGSINLESSSPAKFSEDFRKKYGVKVDIAPGKNAFLGAENIGSRIMLWGLISYGNRVQAKELGANYTVDYCGYIGMVLAKGRIYSLQLMIPVKNSAEVSAVKSRVKAWATDFARKNGVS